MPRVAAIALAFACLAVPAAAQMAVFPPGTAVLASPLSLPDRWEPCIVTQDLTSQGAYQLRCGTSDWTVSMRWVKPAAAGQPAPAPAPPVASPAAAPPGVLAPPRPAAPTAMPAIAAPSGAAPSGGTNGVLPDGIYVAPVGGAIEVLQILGARMALGPRALLTQADFTTAQAALVGSIQVTGTELTVHWNDGKTRTGQFKLDGRCFSWGYLYCRAAPFARGVRLEGRYVGSATAGGGGVSRSSAIAFQADGRYRFTATGAIGAPGGTAGAAASTTADEGRYEIDGWVLRLRSAAGTTRAFLAFPYDVYGPMDPIYLDGGFMRKQP
jgi:hypothetical protein